MASIVGQSNSSLNDKSEVGLINSNRNVQTFALTSVHNIPLFNKVLPGRVKYLNGQDQNN